MNTLESGFSTSVGDTRIEVLPTSTSMIPRQAHIEPSVTINDTILFRVVTGR